MTDQGRKRASLGARPGIRRSPHPAPDIRIYKIDSTGVSLVIVSGLPETARQCR